MSNILLSFEAKLYSVMEMQPFYIGQKVIRIGETVNKVIKGHIYTVAECLQCECGGWIVLLFEFPARLPNHCNCRKCGGVIRKNLNYGGGNAENFAPVQENFQSITFKEVAKEELISVN